MKYNSVNPEHFTMISVHITGGQACGRSKIELPMDSVQDALKVFESILLCRSAQDVKITGHYQYDDGKAAFRTLVSAAWIWHLPYNEKEERFGWALDTDLLGYGAVWHLLAKNNKSHSKE